MRKKLKRNIVASIVFAILCAGLVFGLVLDVQKESLQNQTEQVETQIQVEEVKENEELPRRHPREGGDPGLSVNEASAVLSTGEVKDSRLDSRLLGNDNMRATLSILEEEIEFAITEEMSVYDAMKILEEENKITFEGKNYPSLGFFVTKINSLEAGKGKNLFYYINGEEASVGISNYILKEGDSIEWKLK